MSNASSAHRTADLRPLPSVIHKTFIALDGAYAAASLLSALLLALAFLLRHRLSSRRIPSLRVLRRALLPRRLVASPSGRADVGLFLFNVFLFGLIFGWMLITAHFVAAAVGKGLVTMLGPPQPPALPEIVAMALVVAALLLAYEFAYWLDHYLAHTIPFLWEFHKVHHSAEILSPLTNARMHPVDTVVYYNINALVMGATGGLAQYALGMPLPDHRFWYGSALVLVFSYTVGHPLTPTSGSRLLAFGASFSSALPITRSITPPIPFTSTRTSATRSASSTGCSALCISRSANARS